MQAKFQNRRARQIQRNEVAWNTEFLEGMMFLEIADGPDVSCAVLQQGNLPFGTNFHGLPDQRIGRRFIPV